MRRLAKAALSGAVCLAVLSSCAGLAGKGQEQDLQGLLRSLKEAKQNGTVGTVEGYAFLVMPGVPTPLKNWPVRLLPLSPSLEAAVSAAHEQFVRGGRAPLAAEAFNRARQPITDYASEVARLGHGDLILTVKTAPGEPRFAFDEVPAGRWLLVTELPSKISVLLWAVPVTVTKGEVTHQSLNDGKIWLEGLTP